MFNRPPLGGFDAKLAGAYLLPPTVKPKKKKKPTVEAPEPELDKQAAALANAVAFEKLAEFQRRLASGDLGGGWNPFDQLITK